MSNDYFDYEEIHKMPTDAELCQAKHSSIDTRFTAYNWIVGIIISLQLACFAFMGWLSKEVVQLHSSQSVDHAVIIQLQVDYAKTDAKLDKIYDKVSGFTHNPKDK